MARNLFYRNVTSSASLGLFLMSGVLGVLGVRFYLELTNYPAIEGGGLHIAHVLWGGLLMMAGIIMMLSYLGAGVRRLAVVIAGLGFGVFIDEVGKFVTSDNDYFYRPSIGIIYAIFVIMYLVIGYLTREHARLTSREYQLNALLQLQEAVLHDMDEAERQQALQLLARADQRCRITRSLTDILNHVETVPAKKPSLPVRVLHFFDAKYTEFWRSSTSLWRVRLFFMAEALVVLAATLYASWDNISEVRGLLGGSYAYPQLLLVAELLSSLVAALLVFAGGVALTRNRLQAFELFRQSVLVNILLTDFFIFSREQLRALPGFLLNLAILLLVTYAVHQELRLNAAKNKQP
ncbi:hypothetical protein CR970_00740 [Candidatus Saccharibacteria bacterium]|nr:MAG: hypothetical protein CR970_00740 [Candidatus Saccharibacteria bacterium]